jgi:hypothetical protein
LRAGTVAATIIEQTTTAKEISMRVRSVFDSVKRRSARTAARVARRGADQQRPIASRLQLEALEDRCLLSFNPAVIYPAGGSPNAMVAADFNNDSRLDIAVANYFGGVNVLLGNSGGTFQPALTSATGAGPLLSLAVGDFNGDDKLDLATASDSAVEVLLGTGAGTFHPPARIGLGSDPTSLAVGDFNGDGKLDLGVTSNFYNPGAGGGCGYYTCYPGYPGFYNGIANVLLGNGSGSFAAPSTTALGNGYHTGGAVKDLNGDGRDDFIVSNHEGGTVGVLLANPDGSLGSLSYFGAESNPLWVSAGDVNGDGKFDLVTANSDISRVNVLLGDGSGGFGVAQSHAGGSHPRTVAVADFNGDGKSDLVTANAGDSTVGTLLGDGAGAFRIPIIAAVGTVSAGASATVAGDFNGDRRTDAAMTSSLGVAVLLNNGVWPALDAPLITINDVTVTEGNAGTTVATFTVNLSAAYGQAVTVHYDTADGNATVADGDYQGKSETLTIASGQTSNTFTVTINGDRIGESNESFYVQLSDPINAFIADSTGAGIIMNDEPRVSIDDGPIGVIEGNSGTTNAVFMVRLSAVYDAPLSVNFSTAEGDTDTWSWCDYYGNCSPPPAATSGTDFQAASGTLTFAPGETSKTIPIAIYGDRLGEPDEYFSVNLSASSADTIGAGHAVGIIINDERYASISSGPSVLEGNKATASVTFMVALSAASDGPVTVTYATADGSATVSGGDYQAKTGTLIFGIGETSKTITVLVNGDRLGENDESFTVSLTGTIGAVITNGTAYGYIRDDEPRLSINSVSVKEGNSGTKVMTFTVTLSAAYDQPVTVRFDTRDGSATVAGNDYAAKSGILTFAAGQTTKTITVTIRGDTKKESDEWFNVVLSNASSNAILSNALGWGTILNDDGRKR